jgi:photosystem II stability/assembly factor-like uncharacterized protein
MVLGLGARASLAAQEHAPKGDGQFEHIHALAIDVEGRSLLLGAHTGLFRSEDGGTSWQRVTLSPKHTHPDVMAIAPDPKDPRTIYVGTHEAGVFKTTDGGATWAAMNSGLAGLDVHGLAVDPTAPGKLHAAVREKGEGIYRTTDGGAKWTRVPPSSPPGRRGRTRGSSGFPPQVAGS